MTLPGLNIMIETYNNQKKLCPIFMNRHLANLIHILSFQGELYICWIE